MKLIIAILHKDDKAEMLQRLNQEKIFFTEISTVGGFLREKNTTILIGAEDDKVAPILRILKETSGRRKTVTYSSMPMGTGQEYYNSAFAQPIEVEIGGCVVFVVQLDDMQKF